MGPDKRFRNQPMTFWANVRSISETCGYTKKGTGTVAVPTIVEMSQAMLKLGLSDSHLLVGGKPTPLGQLLLDYFQYRADQLNGYVKSRLMKLADAKLLFETLKAEHTPTCKLPKNKQKGAKSGPAYLTCIVNILIEQGVGGLPVNYDPGKLTAVTDGKAPLRTLSRRVDGAFPKPVDPIAVWEIKEYYNTTSFGSRIADGVFETQLDGMELEELEKNTGRSVHHLLAVDAYDTWWLKGRSYLCRIIDMLHMGYVDEVLFGREVEERLPTIVAGWVAQYHAQMKAAP